MIMATPYEPRTYSGAAGVPTDAWLAFTADVLSALGEAETKKERQQRGYGGLWTKTIPGSLPVAKLIRNYAKWNGKLMLSVNDQAIGHVMLDEPPLATDTGVAVSVQYKIFNDTPSVTGMTLPYPKPEVKDLCQGRWAEFGMARVYAPQLMPELSMHGDDAVLEWSRPLTVQFGKKGLFGFVRWLTQTKLHRIFLGPNRGWFELTGLGRWVIPDLEWAE